MKSCGLTREAGAEPTCASHVSTDGTCMYIYIHTLLLNSCPDWVAAKELELSYHTIGMYTKQGFLNYGSLFQYP